MNIDSFQFISIVEVPHSDVFMGCVYLIEMIEHVSIYAFWAHPAQAAGDHLGASRAVAGDHLPGRFAGDHLPGIDVVMGWSP